MVLDNELIPVDPVKFLITPPLLLPVPKTVMASGITKLLPFIWITAPSETVVLLEPVPAVWLPKAFDFCTWTIPAVILVAPVYVFSPSNNKVPEPSFVKVAEVEPDVLANTPVTVVLLNPPTVNP